MVTPEPLQSSRASPTAETQDFNTHFIPAHADSYRSYNITPILSSDRFC